MDDFVTRGLGVAAPERRDGWPQRLISASHADLWPDWQAAWLRMPAWIGCHVAMPACRDGCRRAKARGWHPDEAGAPWTLRTPGLPGPEQARTLVLGGPVDPIAAGPDPA